MKNSKSYNFEGVTLKVGLILKDSNGCDWEITGCGPKQVMAKCLQLPNDTYTFTAHWHFCGNILKGFYTNKLFK